MSTFRADGLEALEWAARYLERVGELPVLSRLEPGAVAARLPPSPPERPEPFADVLRDLDEVLLPGLTHWQHPRFFAYFASTASEPGILAELLAATLNQVAFLWRTSPASTELELHVLGWLAELLGLPPGWHGHIEDTASTSTLAALAAARALRPDGAVLCSEHAHSSVAKACKLLDLELRRVPADGEYRMCARELEAMLERGRVTAVVATVGTTSSTSVDPVLPIADACEREGVWLHVDAAYAGASWVCPETRWSQAGVERADSVVVNPHKWLFTPMDCSCLWSRRPDALRAAFSDVPEYLRTPESVASLSEYGPALGRRFRSLKLWAVIRCHGREGLQALIREHLRLARLFAGWVVAEPGWELVAPVPFSVVCFRRLAADEDNEALLERANATGELFVSHTRLDGRYVLRLAVGNAGTTEADVARAWQVLKREAEGERTMIITTANDVPGYEVTDVYGEVFGLTVRSRHLGSQIGAGFKSIVGGELKGMTKMLAEGRQQAIDRLVEEAEAKGANAIIAMRFDTSEFMDQATEICAYGTACKVAKR